MADMERVSPTSSVRRYFRYGLLGIQVALVCLMLYEQTFCRSSESDSVQPVQILVDSSSTGQSHFKRKTIVIDLVPDIPKHPERLFYNRVPKCGSHTFLDVINRMSVKNNFTFTRASEYMRFYLEDYWQMKFVDRLRQINTPMLYERHLHFVDFPHYGLSQPIYINLVRDPLQRLVSWYYFRRFQEGHVREMDEIKRNQTFDECVRGNHTECTSMQGDNPEEGYFKVIPFFCGQQDFCRKDQQRALRAAMQNVDQHYLVVGVTEQFADYVGALEHLLPTYFNGANTFYRKSETELRAKHRTTRKVAPSDDVVQHMRNLLQYEYTFYKFIQQKFNKLIYGLRQKENIRGDRIANNRFRT